MVLSFEWPSCPRDESNNLRTLSYGLFGKLHSLNNILPMEESGLESLNNLLPGKND